MGDIAGPFVRAPRIIFPRPRGFNPPLCNRHRICIKYLPENIGTYPARRRPCAVNGKIRITLNVRHHHLVKLIGRSRMASLHEAST